CPNTCGEPEVGVVRETHDIVLGVEWRDWQHRSERFFLHQQHVLRDVGEYGWRIEVGTEAGEPRSSADEACATGDGVSHLCFYDLQLVFVDHGADLDAVVGSLSHVQLARLLRACSDKLVVDSSLNVAALGGKAGLPGIHEGTPHRAGGCNVDVDIVEDNHRI